MENAKELKTPVRTIRQPGIDDQKRDVSLGRLFHVLRPELAVNRNDEIGSDAFPGECRKGNPIKGKRPLSEKFSVIFFFGYGQARTCSSAQNDFHFRVGDEFVQ